MAAPFTLPPLPYSEDALNPVISANTLGFHYGKHHKGYVTKLNELVPGTPYAEMDLVSVIKASHGKDAPVFNNAAQVWNHTFFWNSMVSPNGPTKPSKRMMDMITASFGDFETFKKKFAETGNTQFGSGWAWLVAGGDGKLKITKTANAENPMVMGDKALLTVDVWEHAYYLDYQNRRPDFTTAVIDKLMNWEFAEKNLG